MKVRRICEWCGKEFNAEYTEVKRGGGKFCSPKCYHLSHRTGKTVNCLQCKKPFHVSEANLKNGRGKYCSKKCRDLAHRIGERTVRHCLTCGKTLYVKDANLKRGDGKYCSKKCAGISRRKKKLVTCLYCGKEFLTIPAHLKNGKSKFCSMRCYGDWQRENLRGDNHPNWQGGKIKTICQQCGKDFETHAYRPKEGRGKFCSRSCKNKWQSEHNRGENNPAWKNGISYEPYCSKFNNEFKERIRNKFDNKCFICGKTEEENGKKLSIHHVDYDKTCLCNTSNSCQFVPLCASCHSKTNGNREYWERFLMTKLRNRLDGYYI